MKVTFVYKNNTFPSKSEYVIFENWQNPLPSIGENVSYKDQEFNGLVKRIEWNLDTPNEVYVIIH